MVYVYVLGGIFLFALVAFVWWRYTSVEWGARQCNEKITRILEPLGEKLARKEQIAPDEVALLAAKPHVRPMLYAALKHFERLDLFPNEHLDIEAQGAAELAYWMMHPNELEAPPAQIELIDTCCRGIDGQQAEFMVFRYKMPDGHWAGDDWLLGLSGPFFKGDVPYSGVASAFSRSSDKYGAIQPDELVDWFIGMAGGGG
jgi:hypothetical protein